MNQNTPSSAAPRRFRLSPAVVFVVACLARTAVAWALFSNFDGDIDRYRSLAETLARDGVYGERIQPDQSARPMAFRPPFYSLALAAVSIDGTVASLEVAVLHVLLGGATAVLVFLLARRLELGDWAWLAALLTAIDPILLNQSTLVMTETLATFLTVVCLWMLFRYHERLDTPSAVWTGIVMGASVLCRPTFLPWIALAAVYMALLARPRGKASSHAGAFVLAAVLPLTPWAIRNYWVFEKPIFMTTHGGYTLLLGNNDGFYDFLNQGSREATWDSSRLDAECAAKKVDFDYDELKTDRWCYEQAVETIRRRPADFLYACWVRVRRLWGLAPHAASGQESMARQAVRWAIGVWYAGLFLLALYGVYAIRDRLWQSAWIWGVLLCFAFTSVHAIYWSNLRMRAPLMPYVVLLAVLGARCLFGNKRSNVVPTLCVGTRRIG